MRSIPKLVQQKGQRKLTCLTAYDAFLASVVEASDIDMILVGDSLGHVIQGKTSTIPVTLDEIIYHTRIVSRMVSKTLVIADMPFGSVGISTENTIQNGIRLFKESGAGAIKLEGSTTDVLEAIPSLNAIGVPVMGHIGLQPQSVHVYGGYKVAGKTSESEQHLLSQAKALETAGAFGIVLECVIAEVAQQITESLKIPTIGIGAGSNVDGQVLVTQDLLGMHVGKTPSFVRQYANFFSQAQEAMSSWSQDVQQQQYPSNDESYHKEC